MILIQSHGSLLFWKLEHVDYIQDLGETFDSKLKFDHHINEKVNKSNFSFN